ncbi:MAG: hypothetical protein Q4G69_02705 [Planctomycetia bacterium]|nr:hypothetical protein [Planctomycetia bacterium]
MIRSIIIGLGISTIMIGLQLFCFQELTIKTDVEKSLKIADFLPYSLVCTGLIVYLYGYQIHKV